MEDLQMFELKALLLSTLNLVKDPSSYLTLLCVS